MMRRRTGILLVAFACLLTLFLPFSVPSVESKVILPGTGGDSGTSDRGGEEGGDPDDIAINSPTGGADVFGGATFGVGDERSVVVWTEEYAASREEQVFSRHREDVRLMWLVLKATRLFPFVL